MPELVWREDFAKAKRLSSDWKKKVGATNGTGGKDSKVEIDAAAGRGSSPGSLRLSGGRGHDALERTYVARAPGRAGRPLALERQVKRGERAPRGLQFPNLHLNLAFVDGKGEVVGTRASPSSSRARTTGRRGRRATAVRSRGHEEGPLGAVPVDVGRRPGSTTSSSRARRVLPLPYADWVTMEGEDDRAAPRARTTRMRAR